MPLVTRKRGSQWGTQQTWPSLIDTGQRYKVTYRDGLGQLRLMGHTDDRQVADKWVKDVSRPPFKMVRLIDRGTKSSG